MKANHPLPIKFALKERIPRGNAKKRGDEKTPQKIKG